MKPIIIKTEEEVYKLGEYCFGFYKLGYKRAIKDLTRMHEFFNENKKDAFMEYFESLVKEL